MVTWSDLQQGVGWTPAHFEHLREIMANRAGRKVYGRRQLAAAVGTTERSLYRWEHGITSPARSALLLVADRVDRILTDEEKDALATLTPVRDAV